LNFPTFTFNLYAAVQQDAFEDLDITNCRIDIAFTRVSCKLLGILMEDKFDVTSIRIACFANANTKLGIGYPEDLQKQMTAAKSVAELIEILTLHPTHWSWINIQVMEKIASISNQATKLVEHYKAVISDKTLKEILEIIPEFVVDDNFYARIKGKWDKAVDEMTFKDIQDHRTSIGKIFGINKSAIVLVEILEGCVEINWLLPKMLLDHARNELEKSKATLMDYDIISLDFMSDNLPSLMKGSYTNIKLLLIHSDCKLSILGEKL